METPDHWLPYCEATEGNVAHADKKTAVHRRKVSDHLLHLYPLMLASSAMCVFVVARSVLLNEVGTVFVACDRGSLKLAVETGSEIDLCISACH